uniref:Uncharacterized protein n=1 Tax=Haptolina ericina TaxID=156174 RepID=A0A7S3AL85_9EUKA|mmetsp:Transcript_24699/g.56276  ORF Transcript_24699/g.56276 Transcript_24699/m.56276 type:complete len:1037 (+) Transcript_24699:38-3148(+)|eukprot:CAMPEP_0181185842 /NCGR_PEP_ID=MMETSP1096-20121128/9723_1 /TAXON_ID=156174 ORGANISM="Chrysochromulina ericina, Strain CCMP281" /NCGR_SAMPLE_ID=MMETSP1096 /ASSEMBLY_ACC=CAM_ASM_000453 /LENGTH=1036 /DNA_ID=CAMNT_0023274713 /DNA_START=37 /DNA_END=3147 /DNA_ORIENTATION=-
MADSTPSDEMFKEAQVKTMLARSPMDGILRRWQSIGQGNVAAIRLNWVTFLFATLCTWVWAICCVAGDKEDRAEILTYFQSSKLWVTQNFTWAYILTQDVWCAFLIYLMFSRFGSMKLCRKGEDEKKPRFNDFTWFCMLFTCGVAVGLYVYGVAEPLYFYRQPYSWGGKGGYHYDIVKASVENDGQRAQQAIFMAVYHWGIHGWVPYILLALLCGITSYRWGLPMTIRSCFYPLFGDHALGLVGDIIDAVSISTTTFGVCTSLSLGVGQLAGGLQFYINIFCKANEECEKVGGTWDITGYGAENCFGYDPATPPSSCKASFLKTDETKRDTFNVLIVIITLIATVSVISGLKNGIKILSKVAFSLGLLVCLIVLLGDNTWYFLSVMVQTTGYYLQYIVQVGFDCEAFNQLDFEFRDEGSLYWGSQGSKSAISKLAAVGFARGSIESAGSDCGDQANLCTMGVISGAMGAMLASPGVQKLTATAALTAFRMSQKSIDDAAAKYTNLMEKAFNGDAPAGIPCGSGWNATNVNPITIEAYPVKPTSFKDQPFCYQYTGTNLIDCQAAWAGGFPKCPETTMKETPQWGMCEKYYLTCSKASTYFDDTAPQFMDWWTIFYWAWWITWAPFVGFFVALISEGRTIRNVIIGGFIAPTLFAILWFSVFGGMAIKMQRTAELALSVKPDALHAAVQCGEHYGSSSDGFKVPITPEAKMLAEAGYYMLPCFPRDDQIYILFSPFKNLTAFAWVFLWLGLFIYFITSSDSGSMVDDIIGSSGLSPPYIPYWQKVFWCWTEGCVAIMLILGASEGNVSQASNSLRAASIILGLPYTVFLCMMCPSLYRALKKEVGDTDITTSYRFNTQLLDIFEMFKPRGGSPCSPMTYVTEIAVACFFPFIGVKAAYDRCFPTKPMESIMYAFLVQVGWITWFIMQFLEISTVNMSVLSWVAYIFFTCIVAFVRGELRGKENVWGSPADDFVVALTIWPFVLAQMKMHADTDGKDKPLYFASADELIAELAEADGKSTTIKSTTVTTSPSEMVSSA